MRKAQDCTLKRAWDVRNIVRCSVETPYSGKPSAAEVQRNVAAIQQIYENVQNSMITEF